MILLIYWLIGIAVMLWIDSNKSNRIRVSDVINSVFSAIIWPCYLIYAIDERYGSRVLWSKPQVNHHERYEEKTFNEPNLSPGPNDK